MSLLSTITSSLPNVLNLLQGKWAVQYKVQDKRDENIFDTIKNIGERFQDWVMPLTGQVNYNQQKWQDIDFDTFVDMQEVSDTKITQNPVEGGSFRSENKVRKPRIVKVTLAKAGIGYGIEDTLAEVKSLVPKARYDIGNKKSIQMEFRVITPFDMISGLNLTKLDYTFKRDNGRNMLLMYLTFEEIIEITKGVERVAEKIKKPQDADNQNVGRTSKKDLTNG